MATESTKFQKRLKLHLGEASSSFFSAVSVELKTAPSTCGDSIELWLRIQLGKETAVCPYDGILPRHKRKWSTDTCYDVDKPRKCYAKWEKADMKGHTMYDSIYMKCPEWVNPWRQNANWWLPGTVRRENGDNCLMDAGFSSAVIKMFWNWIEVVVVQRPGIVHFEMS